MLANKLKGSSGDKTYIEDVFSTYLYTGTGSTQTINNGIDLAGKGGMVWLKARGTASLHGLFDTARGVGTFLDTSSTAANASLTGVSAFNSNGFSLGLSFNPSGGTYSSWTFRKAPKFFDVVTFTGSTTNVISHSLGVTPGMIILKQTNGTSQWLTWHRSLAAQNFVYLNTTQAQQSAGLDWCVPTSSNVTFNSVLSGGGQWVAYLFAHDTTTDGLIQCGSYTGNASTTAGPVVNLGWEPQYVMIKRTDTAGNSWCVLDNMRGMSLTGYSVLFSNVADAEASSTSSHIDLLPTGFQVNLAGSNFNASGGTYIYMAIRRGPMRTPTDGTKVFNLSAGSSYSAPAFNSSNFTSGIDAFLQLYRPGGVTEIPRIQSRLTGDKSLTISNTTAEVTFFYSAWDYMNGCYNGSTIPLSNQMGLMFKRAPGFFDVVCYTGTGAARTVNHNLGVAPELMIVKNRSAAYSWAVYHKDLSISKAAYLNYTNVPDTVSNFWVTQPTASEFSVPLNGLVNGSGNGLVAYLFASCPGVSKVGSYTGNGSSQTINCGFTNGARFVMIKRTDSTGDWYVWDTARGIVAANDPHLSLNTTAAEVTTDDTIDPDSTGFIVNQVAATNVNVNAATYIYLAIA